MDADRLRAAMALPGWGWRPGMRGVTKLGNYFRVVEEVFGFVMLAFEKGAEENDGNYYREALEKEAEALPVVEDRATAGCLLALIGSGVAIAPGTRNYVPGWHMTHAEAEHWGFGATVGEACVEVALALGRWPGGEP